MEKCELPAWHAATGQGFKRTPYSHLRAFDKGGEIGYGVRCTSALVHNQVVGEFVGQWLNAQEVAHLDSLVGHEADERTKYLVAFDEKTLERKKASGDCFRYIDCREHGNMMRLLNDCRDAPNCELMAWPRPDPARGIEPKALFLVARHDVPASVELARAHSQPLPHSPNPGPTLQPEPEPSATPQPGVGLRQVLQPAVGQCAARRATAWLLLHRHATRHGGLAGRARLRWLDQAQGPCANGPRRQPVRLLP